MEMGDGKSRRQGDQDARRVIGRPKGSAQRKWLDYTERLPRKREVQYQD